MPDVFISYAREDRERIEPLATALAQRGVSVFWDREIPTGQSWRSHIGRALEEARCVIVAWSQHSIESSWVSEEADEGKERGILVPVLLDAIAPPIGFRSIQAADLSSWQPGRESEAFDQLLGDIERLLGGAAARASDVAAGQRPPSTPTPSAERKSSSRRTLYVLGGALAVVAGGVVVASMMRSTPAPDPVRHDTQTPPRDPVPHSEPDPPEAPPPESFWLSIVDLDCKKSDTISPFTVRDEPYLKVNGVIVKHPFSVPCPSPSRNALDMAPIEMVRAQTTIQVWESDLAERSSSGPDDCIGIFQFPKQARAYECKFTESNSKYIVRWVVTRGMPSGSVPDPGPSPGCPLPSLACPKPETERKGAGGDGS